MTNLRKTQTLFVRLNSSGTRISGEELIYSIYKASFPETKELVENIGMSFLPPSQVISLVSRIALADIDSGKYPPPINVKDFQKKIKDPTFKNKLKELIGNEVNSHSQFLFLKAINLLHSENEIDLPPVLIKKIIKDSPDLILMLLYRIHLFESQSISSSEQKRILATMTALSWFGVNNFKYVRELWGSIREVDFWNKQVLGIPVFKDSNLTMYPLLNPDNLRLYLIDQVINKNIDWQNLNPYLDSNISNTYKRIIDIAGLNQENDLIIKINEIWTYFTDNLFSCKSLILFAQRKYINKYFVDFNQMDSLEDSNTLWDWDHIYPTSWVYYKQGVPSITRLWNNCIGNFRVLALEDNRSENNSLSPKKRLEDDIIKEQSFILENDWKFWEKLENRIYEGNEEMIKIHASAVIHRMVNIYAEWYNSLNVGELYGY